MLKGFDMALTMSGENIFEKLTSKFWVKKKINSSTLQQQEECLCPRELDGVFIKNLWCCQRDLNNIMRLIGGKCLE